MRRGVKKSADLSPCGTFRYRLERTWNRNLASVCWIMLNPSTADADVDDATIRKCVGFAERWGYGKIVVVNLWAFRQTDPRALKRTLEQWARCGDALDPCHEANDRKIERAMRAAHLVVAAWGAHASWLDRGRERRRRVAELAADPPPPIDLKCLGKTKSGEPRHPLMLSYDTPLIDL